MSTCPISCIPMFLVLAVDLNKEQIVCGDTANNICSKHCIYQIRKETQNAVTSNESSLSQIEHHVITRPPARYERSASYTRRFHCRLASSDQLKFTFLENSLQIAPRRDLHHRWEFTRHCQCCCCCQVRSMFDPFQTTFV